MDACMHERQYATTIIQILGHRCHVVIDLPHYFEVHAVDAARGATLLSIYHYFLVHAIGAATGATSIRKPTFLGVHPVNAATGATLLLTNYYFYHHLLQI